MEENIKQFKDEIIRHFDVVAEDLKSEIQTVAEQVADNTEQIIGVKEKLEQHDKQFEDIKDTLGVIKLDLEVIKNDLKQKIGRDEFAILERRVSMIEAKQR